MKRASKSRKNPRAAAGAMSASQYGAAVAVLAGHSQIFPRAVAAELVDNTPAAKRHKFALELAGRRKRRGNPSAKPGIPADMRGVAHRARLFHGRPAKRVKVIEQAHFVPDKQADLGRMIDLVVVDQNGTKRRVRFGAGARQVRLGSNAGGRQMYFTGGDQQVNPATFGAPTDKDYAPLGQVAAICYFTSKAFHNFTPQRYEHKFGQVIRNGRRMMNPSARQPDLHYNARSHRLKLVGGTYRVERAGIVN